MDPNEAQKALAYLRSKGEGKALFSYLQAVVNNGQAVIRSGRTLGYYRDLLTICQRHLRPLQSDYKLLLATFAWSLRLLRYYRAVPWAGEEKAAERRAMPPEQRRDSLHAAQTQSATLVPTDSTATAAPTPHTLPPDTRITGQRAKQVERFAFKGRSIKGVRITPNANQISAPAGKELVLFVEDQATSGGFGGVIVEIDDSHPKQVLVLMKAAKKEK
ncbi:MAG: hypothetical protein HGA65_10635 [Oscillochloris sp.]|nr:hypothetical protein [Oscillochloris sp.]